MYSRQYCLRLTCGVRASRSVEELENEQELIYLNSTEALQSQCGARRKQSMALYWKDSCWQLMMKQWMKKLMRMRGRTRSLMKMTFSQLIVLKPFFLAQCELTVFLLFQAYSRSTSSLYSVWREARKRYTLVEKVYISASVTLRKSEKMFYRQWLILPMRLKMMMQMTKVERMPRQRKKTYRLMKDCMDLSMILSLPSQ